MDRIKADALRVALGFPSHREEFETAEEMQRLSYDAGESCAAPGVLREMTFAYYERKRVLNAVAATGINVDLLRARVSAVGRTAALWEYGIEDVLSPAPPHDQPLPPAKHRNLYKIFGLSRR